MTSSRPQPASIARTNRKKITIRPLWAVLKPGSAVTMEKIGSAPSTTASTSAPYTANATRVTVGRRISAADASISVMPPA